MSPPTSFVTAIDSPLTNALCDRCSLEQKLGRGGMADAWRHADPELQSYVVEASQALGRLAGEPRL